LNRFSNLILGLIFFLISLPLMLIVSILIKFDTNGPIFFISERVGRNNKNFKMIKFRTMFANTEIVESAKLENHQSKITRLGNILRKLSIDEIPQFISVINGQMAIVGPRPALPSQTSLIKKRKKLGIDKILPGITGYAQISGRDFISDEEKLNFELFYMKKRSFLLDVKIILKTIKIVFNRAGVSH
jgi:O-antigen biosynthesis protein WbqP